jgi:hypothetical protein
MACGWRRRLKGALSRVTTSPLWVTSSQQRGLRREMEQMEKMVLREEKLGVVWVVMVVMVEVAAMGVVLAQGAEEVKVLAERVVAGKGTEVEEKKEEMVTMVQQRKIQHKILQHVPLSAHLPLRPLRPSHLPLRPSHLPLRPSHVPLHRDPRQPRRLQRNQEQATWTVRIITNTCIK